MPRRRAQYTTDQLVMDFDTPAPEMAETVAEQIAAEPAGEYTLERAWVDAARRTRTWAMLDPSGAKLAEITTLRGAQKLADLLNARNGSRPAAPKPAARRTASPPVRKREYNT